MLGPAAGDVSSASAAGPRTTKVTDLLMSSVSGPAEHAAATRPVHGAGRGDARPQLTVGRTDTTSRTAGRWSVWAPRGAEVLAGPVAAGLLLALCARIEVDPLDRVGQVSALAAIGLRFLLLGLGVLVLVLVTLRWRGGGWSPAVGRVACAAVAGLATGFVAAGVLVALDGTSWPLFADRGDAGTLVGWVDGLRAGDPMPASYPPLAVHAMSWYADLTGSSSEAALRVLQIVGTAVFAPVAYLAWRLLLAPTWSLVAAVVGSAVLVDPYKPYGPLVLAVLVPVLLVLLRELRRAPRLTRMSSVARGTGLGVALGLLFLTYSGWFVWSAVGAVAAVALVFPWRTGPLHGLVLLGTTTVAFALLSLPHLVGLLGASGSTRDTYFYFDVFVEPAYIAMWRGDLPGPVGVWPPPGELGGVGLFTLVLVAGLGVAVWLAGRHSAVIGLTMLLAGAWLMRLWFAQQMFGSGSVQLYPRTTQEILYCSLILVGSAGFAAVQRLRPWWRGMREMSGHRDAEEARSATGAGSALPAVVVAVLALGLFAGSATADRFMPRADGSSVGFLAYTAQLVRQPDGRCPEHAGRDCADSSTELVEGFAERSGQDP